MNIFSTFREYYGNRFDPKNARMVTDLLWYGSVRVSAGIVLLALFLGGWFLFDAQFASRVETEDMSGVETVNRTQLRDVLERLSQKELQYQALKRSAPSIVDPAR